MCGGTPWRELQLTRVSKSSQDAICHTGNRWRSWPLRAPSPARLITFAVFRFWRQVRGKRWRQCESQSFSTVKVLLEERGGSLAPHLQELRRLCAAAQKVSTSATIRSRLCNRHQSDVGGYTRLERGEGWGRGSWHRRTGLPVLHGEWQEEADLTAAFHVGITACSNIETEKWLCGKIQLWVSESLNVY